MRPVGCRTHRGDDQGDFGNAPRFGTTIRDKTGPLNSARPEAAWRDRSSPGIAALTRLYRWPVRRRVERQRETCLHPPCIPGRKQREKPVGYRKRHDKRCNPYRDRVREAGPVSQRLHRGLAEPVCRACGNPPGRRGSGSDANRDGSAGWRRDCAAASSWPVPTGSP